MTVPDPPPSLNARQARFIREYAFGNHPSMTSAAKAVGYGKVRAGITASAIMKRDDAREYYNRLTGAVTEEVAKKVAWEKEDLANYYISILTQKPSQATESNHLCDKIMTPEGEAYTHPSKIQAARALAEVMQWNKPKEDTSTRLAGALEAILIRKDI